MAVGGFNLQQLLGSVYLTGLFEAIKTGIPRVVPDVFWNLRQNTKKDMGRYTRVQGTRRTARRIEYGSATRKRPLKEVGTYDVKLLTLGENIVIDVQAFMSLHNYNEYEPENIGMEEIERQGAQFKSLFDNTEIALLYSVLANGKIWFDASGNLLSTATGATLTIDYGLSASNLNQLGGLLTLGWQNPNADIPTMLLNVKDQSLFDTGYELDKALYGRSIPSYFANNTQMQQYLARWPNFRDHFLQTNEIANGMFELDWIRVSAAFYDSNTAYADPSTQTISQFFSTSAVTFTVGIERQFFEWLDGQILVPTTFNPFGNLQGAVGSFEIKNRMGSWAVPTFNPISAEIHYQLVTLPVIKFPSGMYLAQTNF